MSITNELREWFKNRAFLGNGWQEIHDIADRIDMEHERRMEERADQYSELRAKINNGYIELPKDADNVPWNIGDRDENGNEVTELKLTVSGWWAFTNDEWPFCPERHRHYHTQTVEDVLHEFTDAILDWAVKSGTVIEVGTWNDVAAEYIAKLQLKED